MRTPVDRSMCLSVHRIERPFVCEYVLSRICGNLCVHGQNARGSGLDGSFSFLVMPGDTKSRAFACCVGAIAWVWKHTEKHGFLHRPYRLIPNR